MHIRWITIILLCVSASFALAQPAEHPVRAELIADVASVQPGSTFHLGVKLTMQPGWHVYWINPGDSGLPTQVTFTTPGGFKTEFLGHPTPMRFVMPGNVVGYGYSDSLLLIATVTAPADLKPGTPLSFSAAAKWLVCKDVCLPGKAAPSIQLDVREKPEPANLSLFADWLDRLPADVGDKAAISAKNNNGDRVIALQWREPVQNVQVFTAPGDAWAVNDLQVSGDANRTEIRFKPEQLDKSVKSVEMTVVVAYDDSKGRRRSVKLTDRLGAE